MKTRVFLTILLLGLTSQLLFAEDKSQFNDQQVLSKIPVLLFLRDMDSSLYSSMMANPNQLTITPTGTFAAVRAIRVTGYNTGDNSCGGGVAGTQIADNGSGVTVALNSGTAYATTDASLWAMFIQDPPGFDFTNFNDTKFELLGDPITSILATSLCIQGTGDTNNCDGPTNCGWSSAQTWNPTP